MRGIILKGGQGLLLFGAFGVCILFVCICIGLSSYIVFLSVFAGAVKWGIRRVRTWALWCLSPP